MARILIVEDEKNAREALGEVFSAQHEVRLAAKSPLNLDHERRVIGSCRPQSAGGHMSDPTSDLGIDSSIGAVAHRRVGEHGRGQGSDK